LIRESEATFPLGKGAIGDSRQRYFLFYIDAGLAGLFHPLEFFEGPFDFDVFGEKPGDFLHGGQLKFSRQSGYFGWSDI
jgi:hypothetical protein